MGMLMHHLGESGLEQRVRRREAGESLLALASALPREQRLLLEQIYQQGQSFADLSHLCQCPAWKLRRRVARIVRRLRHPRYRFLLTRRELLDSPVRRCAELAYLHGLTQRQIACHTGWSLHQVRQHLRAFDLMIHWLGVKNSPN